MRAIILGLTILFPRALAAQQGITPDSAFRAFTRATVEQRWSDAAQFVDLVHIAEARRAVIQSSRERPPSPDVDEYLRNQPTMPRAVAEYFVAQAEEMHKRFRNILVLQSFANVEDTTTLMRLSPMEAAARYVQAMDPRYAMTLAFRIARGCEQRMPGLADIAATAPGYEVLATAVRGDTAWVMHRDTARNASHVPFTPAIARLFRKQERWFVDLDYPQGSFGSGSLFPVDCTTADSTAARRP